MPDDASTSRTAVKTYVPTYQKEAWKDHADDLEMSLSEFVRTMVQAGRRHFDGVEPAPVTGGESGDAEDSSSNEDLTAEVRSLLATESMTWDALLAAVTDDVEQRLEDSLDELQEANVVKYSGRDGGYTLIEP